jgi:hypothetical protein
MTSTNFSQNRGDSARELASKALLEQTEMELDKFLAIQEIADDAVRLATIAEKQIEALQAWRASLIIATTQGEYRAIADAVRQAMKEKAYCQTPNIPSRIAVALIAALTITERALAEVQAGRSQD